MDTMDTTIIQRTGTAIPLSILMDTVNRAPAIVSSMYIHKGRREADLSISRKTHSATAQAFFNMHFSNGKFMERDGQFHIMGVSII